MAANTNTNPAPATVVAAVGALPKGTRPEGLPTAAQGVQVGDTAWIHSRGQYRRGIVTKVGTKNVTVRYTTAGAVAEAAANMAACAELAAKYSNEAPEGWRKSRVDYYRQHGTDVAAYAGTTEPAKPASEVYVEAPAAPDAAVAPEAAAPAAAEAPAAPELPQAATEWLDRLLCQAKRTYAEGVLQATMAGTPEPEAPDAEWAAKTARKARRLAV